MKTSRKKVLRATLFGLIATSWLLGILAVQLPGGVYAAAAPVAQDSELIGATIYLPTVSNDHFSSDENFFGVDVGPIYPPGVDIMQQAGAYWLRRGPLPWSDVEPSIGTRNWEVLAQYEQELLNAQERDMQVILIVGSTPAWAQKVGGYTCGPIKTTELTAFGNFMYDLVKRYSVPPYNVKHWELYNEPDIDFGGGGDPTSEFGCWGDGAQFYYGGEYYADMLAAVYPRIKAADPEEQVLVGGLLLGCEPRFCGASESEKRPGRFFEGILRHNGLNDGGSYFDGVSFHAYDYYTGLVGDYLNLKWNSTAGTTGPVSAAKADYLNGLMAQYGVVGKYLMNTESAVVCGGFNDPPGKPPCEADPYSAYEMTKAYYVTQAYAVAIAKDFKANVWYSMMGWRNSGLLNNDLSLRPAYSAYQTARRELSHVQYQNEITQYAGVMGYAFKRGNETIWVVWSLDRNPHTIALASQPDVIFDALGNSVPAASSIMVDLKPLIIEWLQ